MEFLILLISLVITLSSARKNYQITLVCVRVVIRMRITYIVVVIHHRIFWPKKLNERPEDTMEITHGVAVVAHNDKPAGNTYHRDK